MLIHKEQWRIIPIKLKEVLLPQSRQHQDNIVIAKLRTNTPLTSDDVKALENILWEEVSRQIYFVNQIVDIFTDMTVWMGIKRVIDTINANAAA